MLHFQVTPEKLHLADHIAQVDSYMQSQRAEADMNATRYQMERLPVDLHVLSGVQSILPAIVYLPNKHETPPSLAIGEASSLNSEFLHHQLKTKVRDSQKNRYFRNSPVVSAIIADDGHGRHLFIDEDSEDAPRYQTAENRELFKSLYGIDTVQAGEELNEDGICLVGLVRVISGARKKAEYKQEPEDPIVDRFLLDLFDAMARSGKSSDVYARLVQENSKYRTAQREHPAGSRYK